MDTCKPVTKLIEAAHKALDRMEAWRDSARITHQQTNSRASANMVQNYGNIAQSLKAALQPFEVD